MRKRYWFLLILGLLFQACGSLPSQISTSQQTEIATQVGPAANTQSSDNDSQYELSKWNLWSGNEALLRGANISQALVILELDGSEFKGPGPVGPPYTQADFDRLAALGANYVSISGPGIFSIQPPYEVLPEIVAYYDEILAMIAQADMFATIGFRSGPGRADWSICCAELDWAQPYLVDTVWQDRAAQAAWAEMWQAAAEHFRDNNIVVGYKLMVEPNAAAFHLQIYDPEAFYAGYAGSTYDWNSFFPDIIAAIRQVDANTPILVSGDDYSSIEWLPHVALVDDDRTAYFVDQYAPHLYTHQTAEDELTYPGTFDTDYDGEMEEFGLAWLQQHMAAVAEFEALTGAQATVEEYGLVRFAPGGAEYLDNLMSLFEDQGLNYAVWEWASFWTPYSSQVNDFNWRFGTDPENTVDVVNPLQAVLARYWALNRLRPSNVSWLNE